MPKLASARPWSLVTLPDCAVRVATHRLSARSSRRGQREFLGADNRSRRGGPCRSPRRQEASAAPGCAAAGRCPRTPRRTRAAPARQPAGPGRPPRRRSSTRPRVLGLSRPRRPDPSTASPDALRHPSCTQPARHPVTGGHHGEQQARARDGERRSRPARQPHRPARHSRWLCGSPNRAVISPITATTQPASTSTDRRPLASASAATAARATPRSPSTAAGRARPATSAAGSALPARAWPARGGPRPLRGRAKPDGRRDRESTA